MGKHSNKKPKTTTFAPIFDSVKGVKVGYADPINPTPPQVPFEHDFDFVQGNLGKVHRIVARRKLKDRIKFLETIIKVHQPLTQALKVTNKAFQDGVMEGIRQVAAAEREREAAKKQEATDLIKNVTPENRHPEVPVSPIIETELVIDPATLTAANAD